MIKIAFALAAAGAVFMTSPLLVGTVPAKAQNFKTAQADVRTGAAADVIATSPSASAQAASPSAHGDTAAR